MRIRLLAILPEKPSFLLLQWRKETVCKLKIDWLEALNTDEDDFGFIENHAGNHQRNCKEFFKSRGVCTYYCPSDPKVSLLLGWPVIDLPFSSCHTDISPLTAVALSILLDEFIYDSPGCSGPLCAAARKREPSHKKLLSRLLRMQSITNDLIQYTKSSSLEAEWLRPTSQPFFVE